MNKYSLLVGVFSIVVIFNTAANSEGNTEKSADNTQAEEVEGRVARASNFIDDSVKSTGEYVGDFCKETIVEHPKKLAVAGAFKLWHLMDPREYIEFTSVRVYEGSAGTKTTYMSSLLTRSFKSTSLPFMIVGYSVGNTIYNRLKK